LTRRGIFLLRNLAFTEDGADNEADFRAHAKPVYETLNKLVVGEGEISKKKDVTDCARSTQLEQRLGSEESKA
jgi:sister-chromatid-cohesion protein PDS5